MKNNTKLVSESLGNILKPKSESEVTQEIERRLKSIDKTEEKRTNDYVIYKIIKGSDIKEIIKHFSGRDEDVFFNFYLILDNSTQGFRQVIGVKVSPDGTINALDAKGQKVDEEHLKKFV